MNKVPLASAIHFPGRRKKNEKKEEGGEMYGGGGKAKNSAANALPTSTRESAWASPPRPREGRQLPERLEPPSAPSSFFLGLRSESCFLRRTAARTRHLPPGCSRGLAGGAAGMRRAAGGFGAGLRGAAATRPREPAPCRRPLAGRAVPPGAAPGLPLAPRGRRRPSARGLR